MLLRLTVLLLLVCAGASAQQYPFIPIAGSPKNIEHILQDRQGRLWIGTSDDVLCFDGTRFFSLHGSGFPHEAIFSLAEDDEGGILIGAQIGAYRFSEGHLERLPVDAIQTRAIGVAPGVLLVWGIRSGSYSTPVYRVRRFGTVWESTRLEGWSFGEFATRDRTGAIVTACAGGWCEYSARSIEDWSPAKSVSPIFHRSNEALKRIFKDRSGCVWFRFLESAAYQCPADSSAVPLPAAIAGRNVWASLDENSDGSILFANASSIAVGRPGAFQVVTPDNGLPAEVISCAIQARDGSIWAGSLGGLYRSPYPFRLTYWKSRFGPFWSIVRSGGKLFAGTSAGVAELGEHGAWSVFPSTQGLGTMSSLLPDGNGGVYAAVSGKAVIHLRQSDGVIDARTPPGHGFEPQYLTRAGDNAIWASGNGFYKLSRSGDEITASLENPQGTSPSDAFIAYDLGGGLWGCFSGRVIQREGNQWRTMARDGIPQGLCRSLAFTKSGDLWPGYNIGFAWLHRDGGGVQVRVLPARSDVGWLNAYSFASDTRGWLWRGAGDGMHVADESEAQRGVWILLNEIDGLTNLDVNHNSFFADPDGSVWWSSGAGVFKFAPPPNLVNPPTPPEVSVSAFSTGSQAPKLAGTVNEFPFHQNLHLYFASLQFQARSAIRVRYRLLPAQKDWREANSFELDVGTPWWGAHTLEFQSRFITGAWSRVFSQRLIVAVPWWFSWPALIAFAGIGFGGAAGGVAWRKKLKLRARNRLPDLDDLRIAVLSPEIQPYSILDRRFQVLDIIARGGFATVLKGRDLSTQRPCAIKIFRHDVLDQEWIAHRFQQEVSALEQIRHNSVVSIYGHGVAPSGAPYLVMELIEGGTLRGLLDSGPLDSARAASLLEQVSEALTQIHGSGIFHRDLKPANLMLRADAPRGKELVLIDFSIAIVKEPDQTIHGLSRAAGTIYYMAPEQAVGFAMAASDIYSLAKILLEMLTGQRLSSLLPDASMDLPQRVKDFVRTLPIRLSAESVELIGSALEFDPARRPQVARRFAGPIVRDLLAASSGRAANLSPSPNDDESAAGSAR